MMIIMMKGKQRATQNTFKPAGCTLLMPNSLEDLIV